MVHIAGFVFLVQLANVCLRQSLGEVFSLLLLSLFSLLLLVHALGGGGGDFVCKIFPFSKISSSEHPKEVI